MYYGNQYQSPYNGGTTNQNHSYGIFGSVRSLIYFFQIFGTIFAMLGLTIYILFMAEISRAIGNSPEAKATVSLILAILSYLAVKTLIACIIICRFVKNNSDEDILANRFIISALSLNLGGFCTPFLLTRLPNIPVKSTINPRLFLARSMGLNAIICAPIGLMAYFLSIGTGMNALNTTEMFQNPANPYTLSVLIISSVITLFGAITCLLFFTKKGKEAFETKKGFLGFLTKIIAGIWLIIVTIELFLTMFFAIMRLMGAISDLIRAGSSDGFGKSIMIFMAFINLMLTMVYVIWLLQITASTIKGIWSPQGVVYGKYEALAKSEEKARKKNKN